MEIGDELEANSPQRVGSHAPDASQIKLDAVAGRKQHQLAIGELSFESFDGIGPLLRVLKLSCSRTSSARWCDSDQSAADDSSDLASIPSSSRLRASTARRPEFRSSGPGAITFSVVRRLADSRKLGLIGEFNIRVYTTHATNVSTTFGQCVPVLTQGTSGVARTSPVIRAMGSVSANPSVTDTTGLRAPAVPNCPAGRWDDASSSASC